MSGRGKSQIWNVIIRYCCVEAILTADGVMKILFPMLKNDGNCVNHRYNLCEKQVYAARQGK